MGLGKNYCTYEKHLLFNGLLITIIKMVNCLVKHNKLNKYVFWKKKNKKRKFTIDVNINENTAISG